MKKIIVFGSSGVLGRIIAQQVLSQFGEGSLVVSDYVRARAEKLSENLNLTTKPRIVDIRDANAIQANLDNVSGAIIAAKQSEPLLQKECIARGIATVDVTVYKAFAERVQRLDDMARANLAPTLVLAGFFPGLSGIAVNALVEHFTSPREIRVSLLQSTNASAGSSGFVDMLNILSGMVSTNGGKARGFTRSQTFYHSDHNKVFRQYLIKSDEAEILRDRLKVKVAYYTGWEKKSFNLLIKGMNRSGLSQFLANNPLGLKLAAFFRPPKQYTESSQEKTSLTITGVGYQNLEWEEKSVHINAKADYLATAVAATTMLKLILQNKAQIKGGVFMPYQLFDLSGMKACFSSSEIDISVVHNVGRQKEAGPPGQKRKQGG